MEPEPESGRQGNKGFGAAMAAKRQGKKKARLSALEAASKGRASRASCSSNEASVPTVVSGISRWRADPALSPARTRGEGLVKKPDVYSPGVRIVKDRDYPSRKSDGYERSVKNRLVNKEISEL